MSVAPDLPSVEVSSRRPSPGQAVVIPFPRPARPATAEIIPLPVRSADPDAPETSGADLDTDLDRAHDLDAGSEAASQARRHPAGAPPVRGRRDEPLVARPRPGRHPAGPRRGLAHPLAAARAARAGHPAGSARHADRSDHRPGSALHAEHPAAGRSGHRPGSALQAEHPAGSADRPGPRVGSALHAEHPAAGRSGHRVGSALGADELAVAGELAGAAAADLARRPSVRLTRRGRLVVTTVVTLAVAGLLTVLGAGAGGAAPPAPATAATGPAAVVVQPGDTLWSIARRVAPDRDTRQVVDDLRRLNALPGTDLEVGQRLLVHP
jgi:LysM domain